MGGGNRRPTRYNHNKSGRRIFIGGGNLIDWNSPSPCDSGNSRRSGSRSTDRHHPRGGNGFAYTYPSTPCAGADAGASISIIGSGEGTEVFAYVDTAPRAEPSNTVPIYDYSAHRGLGFDEGDDHSNGGGDVGGECLDGVMEDVGEEKKELEVNEKRRDAFISIGGVRIYSEDTSSPTEGEDHYDDDDDDDDDEDRDEEDDESEDDDDEDEKGESDGHESSSLASMSGSDVDEDDAVDYMEGIGGRAALLKESWLTGKKVDAWDEDMVFGSAERSRSRGRLGGFALMNASEEYGMQMPKHRKAKGNEKIWKGVTRMVEDGIAMPEEDMLFLKDARMDSGWKKKKHSQFSKSWPGDAKGMKYRNFPGRKKKHHKELIAIKRHQRMINRGVDLGQINSSLRRMVIDEVNMLSFQTMHSKDCSQVQRLASIYQLSSGCQGSGNKRFVSVTRTEHTCLPSSIDKIRLDKLLAPGLANDFAVNHVSNGVSRGKGTTKTRPGRKLFSSAGSHYKSEGNSSASSRPSKNSEINGRKTRYFQKPISFVSTGVMQTDLVLDPAIMFSSECRVPETNADISVSETVESSGRGDKDFGSPLITKVGFVEGDEQEMNESFEAINPSRSAVAELTPSSTELTPSGSSTNIGSFEMHTKGFGSKMMAKMGFIEGRGLGKDAQGLPEPIKATRRPKSLGLGVEFTEAIEETSTVKYRDIRTSGKNQKVCVGSFEKHTKGFGSKMMSKMGFIPGTGLGKDAQGIMEPLTAVKRPKSQGLGAKSK